MFLKFMGYYSASIMNILFTYKLEFKQYGSTIKA